MDMTLIDIFVDVLIVAFLLKNDKNCAASKESSIFFCFIFGPRNFKKYFPRILKDIKAYGNNDAFDETITKYEHLLRDHLYMLDNKFLIRCLENDFQVEYIILMVFRKK